MRKLMILVTTVLAALALSAGPAMAHPHDKAANGFVGPTGTPIEASGGQAGVAHQGIQCAQDFGNPHLTDLGLDCPAN